MSRSTQHARRASVYSDRAACAACGRVHRLLDPGWIWLLSGDLLCAGEACWAAFRSRAARQGDLF